MAVRWVEEPPVILMIGATGGEPGVPCPNTHTHTLTDKNSKKVKHLGSEDDTVGS